MLALLALAPQAPAADPSPYAEGQVWEYRTRATERDSRLKIQQIEIDPSGHPIHHITLIGLRLGQRGEVGGIDHLPVSRASPDASVTRLSTSIADFPDPAEGIAHWRAAQGGVFDASIIEILEIIEASLRQAPPELQP